MKYNFSSDQISGVKKLIRKKIYYLLLYVDPDTCGEFSDVDVSGAFESLIDELGGINELLSCPVEMINVMGLLKAAQKEYESENFNFKKYKKFVLGSGAEVLKIKEV